MAGDWIKMRPSLLTSPKVNGIARTLESCPRVGEALSTAHNGALREIVTRSVMRHVTVASLLVIWGAANEHTRDGVFHNADLSDLDDLAGIPGFGDAMASAGWAVYNPDENSVTLPNFSEYNTSGEVRSANAKSAAQRQREYRERQKSRESVTQSDVTRDVTNDVTRNRREEKRREDISIPDGIDKAQRKRSVVAERPAQVDASLWADFQALRKSKRAPITQAALAGIEGEATKAGWDLPRALAECCARGWAGFKADWVIKAQPARQNIHDERTATLAALTGRSESHEPYTIDADAIDASHRPLC